MEGENKYNRDEQPTKYTSSMCVPKAYFHAFECMWSSGNYINS